METLPLLEAGFHVTAVDLSTRMLDRLRRSAEAGGVSERLDTVRLRLRDLDQLAGSEFDGAFSTFGALNCEPDLAPVVRALRSRLPPGAILVAGTFQPLAPLETIAYTLLGRPSRAFGRLAERVPADPGSRFTVDWFPRSTSRVARSFSPGFRLEAVAGIGGVLPPPELAPRLAALGWPLERWLGVDERWGARWPGRWLGDQELLVLRRTGEVGTRQKGGKAEGATGSRGTGTAPRG